MAKYTKKVTDNLTITYDEKEWQEIHRGYVPSIAEIERGRTLWLFIWWPLIIIGLAFIMCDRFQVQGIVLEAYWSLEILRALGIVFLLPICLTLMFIISFWAAGIGSDVDSGDRVRGAIFCGIIMFLIGALASLISMVSPYLAWSLHILFIIFYPTVIARCITGYGFRRSMIAGIFLLVVLVALFMPK